MYVIVYVEYKVCLSVLNTSIVLVTVPTLPGKRDKLLK